MTPVTPERGALPRLPSGTFFVRIIVRPLLVSGMFDPESATVLVDVEQSAEQQFVALMHELLHLLGLRDEKAVEEIAQLVLAERMKRAL